MRKFYTFDDTPFKLLFPLNLNLLLLEFRELLLELCDISLEFIRRDVLEMGPVIFILTIILSRF